MKKNTIKIVNQETKKRMMEVLSRKVLAPNELIKYKKMLPSSCFVNGNKAAVNMDEVNRYIVSSNELSFAKNSAERWKSALLNIEGKKERYAALKVLGAVDYGCKLTQPIYQLIANIAKVDIEIVPEKESRETRILAEGVCDILHIDINTYHDAMENGIPMTTAMIENAIKNINKKIAKSRDKRILAKSITLLADPSLETMQKDVDTYKPKYSITKVYSGTNMRPDYLLGYLENGERKYLVGEHFGWHGSQSYFERQRNKVENCINNCIPMFITADSPKEIHIDKATNADGLEEKVWEWQLSQIFFGETEMDAVYASLYNAMEYAGILKFMPTPDKLFLK